MFKKLLLLLFVFSSFSILGQIKKSLVLNGSTDFLEVKDHNDLDFKDTLSAECWIKVNCSDGMVFSKEWCSGRFSYYLNVSNNKLVWTFSKDGYCNYPNVYSSTNKVVPNDTFIHVAVMHTINNVTLFVNGKKISGGFISGGNGRIYAGSSPLRIGVYKGKPGNFGAYYSGYIDELRLWNIGLTEKLIQKRMSDTLAGNETGLILYFDMEDTGRSNKLTLKNKSTYGAVMDASVTNYTNLTPYTALPSKSTEKNLIQKDTIFTCKDITLKLDSGNYKSIVWNNNINQDTINVSTSNAYTVKVETEKCKFFYDTVVVVFIGPIERIKFDTICSNDSVLFQNNYYKTTGVFKDTILSKKSCDTIYALSLLVRPIPRISLGKDTAICNDESITLNATYPGATYKWHNDSTYSTFKTKLTGLFWVKLELNSCSYEDSIMVTISPYKRRTIPLRFCENDSIRIGNKSYTEAGTFYDTIPSGQGCDEIITYKIKTDTLPVVFLGKDTTLCYGSSMRIETSKPIADFLWQDNSTKNYFKVNQPGKYYVQVKQYTCTASDTIEIGYYPEIKHLQYDTFCLGDSFVFNKHVYKKEGSYYDTLSSKHACDSIIITSIVVNPLPIVNLGKDTSVCSGDLIQFDVQLKDASYLWNDLSTKSKLKISNPGTYWVQVKNNKCSNSDTIRIKLLDYTRLSINDSFCENDSSYILGKYYTKPGKYYDTLSSISHCDTIFEINLLEKDKPVFDFGKDTTLCLNKVLMFDFKTNYANYLWQDNTTSSSIIIDKEGLYWVRITVMGCTSTDSIKVKYIDCDKKIFIPNVFTAGNDNYNDLFEIEIGEYQKVKGKIINRWGQVVYDFELPKDAYWNGKMNNVGVNCPTGTYYYVLEFLNAKNNKEDLNVNGIITLIRPKE